MTLFGPINQAVFDWPWSGIHFLSGTFVASVLLALWPRMRSVRFWTSGVAVLVAWELVEATLRYLDANAHAFIAPLKSVLHDFAFAIESPANTAGDIVIGSVGIGVVRLFGMNGAVVLGNGMRR